MKNNNTKASQPKLTEEMKQRIREHIANNIELEVNFNPTGKRYMAYAQGTVAIAAKKGGE